MYVTEPRPLKVDSGKNRGVVGIDCVPPLAGGVGDRGKRVVDDAAHLLDSVAERVADKDVVDQLFAAAVDPGVTPIFWDE
jgi:hypothetical protein